MFKKKIKAGLGNHQPQNMYGVFPSITSCWLNWCSEFKELRCEVTSWSNGLLWVCLQEYTSLEAIQRILLKDDGWRVMMTSGFNACKCYLVICKGGLSRCWNWYGDTGSICVCASMFYCPTFLVCSRKYHLSFSCRVCTQFCGFGLKILAYTIFWWRKEVPGGIFIG